MKYRTIYSRLPNHVRNYMEKGIRVCDEWLTDAAEFDRWALANGWREGLTIDRIDHAGDYEPSNCQFLTQAENNQKSRTVKLTWAKVNAIRARHVPGSTSYKALAFEFGISERHLHDIVAGRRWKPAKVGMNGGERHHVSLQTYCSREKAV